MSNVTALRAEPPSLDLARLDPDRVALHPGTVLAMRSDGAIDVELPGGARRARLALQIPYRPALGDVLLTIADAESCWVIGVVSGAGVHDLTLEGDVRLQARNGTLRLGADRGVEIEAPELSLVARRLSFVADAVVQRCRTLRQRVVDLLEVTAGQSRTTVDGTAYTQAKNATLVASEAVVVNGKAIHLG